MKRIAACGAAAAVMLSAAAPVSCEEGIAMDKNEIIIDGASANLNENMRYRGAGMVSANNSSRLLLDYKAENPEAYREILRYMFGKEGIGITHLKLEMLQEVRDISLRRTQRR